MVADLIFYMFAAVLLAAGVGVIAARNPMHAILFMVLAFFNAAGLFMLLGAEFIALLMIMVYVGAIAVMFLFVLMTIDIDFALLKEGFTPYLPVGLVVAILLLVEIGFAATSGLFSGQLGYAPASLPADHPDDVQNIVQLGRVLFTDYAYPFIAVGMVLLTAMIGAIVLAHRKREGVRRQNIPEQIARPRAACVELKKVPSGKGLGEMEE